PRLEREYRSVGLQALGEWWHSVLGVLAPEGGLDPVRLGPVAAAGHGVGAGRHRRAVLPIPELRSGSESPDQSHCVHTNASCWMSSLGTSSGTRSASLARRQSSTSRASDWAADLFPCLPAA